MPTWSIFEILFRVLRTQHLLLAAMRPRRGSFDDAFSPMVSMPSVVDLDAAGAKKCLTGFAFRLSIYIHMSQIPIELAAMESGNPGTEMDHFIFLSIELEWSC